MLVNAIIVNRNLLSSLKDTVEFLRKEPRINKILIVDHDSTYPELLEWYKNTDEEVDYVKSNGSAQNAWNHKYSDVRKQYFILADPDCSYEGVPDDWLNKMFDVLNNTDAFKVGFSLEIEDLPDTEIGKGFINFKIKPRPGYAVGDIIPNNANIYFDTNPAITTNTFNTEFVATLGNPTFTSEAILMYPNPANQSVTIDLSQSTENLSEIVFFDIVGKRVKVVNSLGEKQMTVNVSDLSKGIYLIEIQTENQLKTIKKLMIQ